MTNILQVSKFYHPKVGGIERVVQQTAEGIANHGLTVRVLCSAELGLGLSFHRNNVRVSKVSSAGVLLSVPITPTFPVHLRAAVRDADIVHYHLPDPLAVTSHLIAVGNQPTVATYHSDIVRQATAAKFYRPILKRFLSSIDRILVTSPRLLEHSEVLQSYIDKCTVVPLSVDTADYGSYDGPEYDLPVDDNRPLILSVGRLNYYKGIEYLLDAMMEVNADLVIVGDGPRLPQLEQQAKKNGVTERVYFLRRIDEQKLHYCYNRADIFAFPSVEPSEAFGIAQLEAMAYRTPIVNTSLPTGVPWVSKDGETGLTVPPRNASALAGAINTLVADSDLRRQYGNQARSRVKKLFTIQRMVTETQQTYEDLLTSS